MDGGVRYETSDISSAGDVILAKTLQFAKPRLTVSWTPIAATQLRPWICVAVVVPSHTSATILARSTDLIALTANNAEPGLRTFQIPLELPRIDVGMAWHPRNDADPAHRWFRNHLADNFIQSRRT